MHVGNLNAPWSDLSPPVVASGYFPPDSAVTEDLDAVFCKSRLNVRIGDSFNLRQFVHYKKNSSKAIDWSVLKFTYVLASANDPTSPPDWNLHALNSGTDVVPTIDDANSNGNQGVGQKGDFRVYIYRVSF